MGVVIIGGGQAGLQVADSLRRGGYAGSISVIAEEEGLPYQRPPLSKDFLLPGKSPSMLPLRGETFFAENGIDLHAGMVAVSIDRGLRTVTLNNGAIMPYEHLVFATGAASRRLSCPGADLPGVHGLKTLGDAVELHNALARARNVVVIGAGFIGLEFAAAARAHGCNVSVLEFAARPMGRALSPVMADFFTAAHIANGVQLRLGEGIDHFSADAGGRVCAAISTSGMSYPADLVVAGIGVTANDSLAAAAGLETANGIVVDQALRTVDENVLAVGDCANFPSSRTGNRIRLESVQNATGQARHAALTILHGPEPYSEVPWFWSTQGSIRLQIAGLSAPGDHYVVSGDPEAGKFSILCFRGEQLTAVESVNSPADHMSARRLLATGNGPTRDDSVTPDFSLKTFARRISPTLA